MISEECYELGSRSSIIREIFSFGLKRKAEIGADKVYDFSLGNPSIPAPESVKKAILELMRTGASSGGGSCILPGAGGCRCPENHSGVSEPALCGKLPGGKYLYDLWGGCLS